MIKFKMIRLPNGSWVDPTCIVCIEVARTKNANNEDTGWTVFVQVETRDEIKIEYPDKNEAVFCKDTIAEMVNVSRI